MKLLVVRLLFPKGSYTPSNSSAEELQSQTQASQARAALAIQDREDAAIKLHVTTMAPQTPYSTPQVVWRPGGQGVFVNADDGVIRGVDTQSGKVVALLKGHEVGSKVRTLWAGWEGQGSEGRSELLVSGGFDKKVLFWRVGKSIST
jgi:WD40 repeat protein